LVVQDLAGVADDIGWEVPLVRKEFLIAGIENDDFPDPRRFRLLVAADKVLEMEVADGASRKTPELEMRSSAVGVRNHVDVRAFNGGNAMSALSFLVGWFGAGSEHR
jgi:hypothetical protein